MASTAHEPESEEAALLLTVDGKDAVLSFAQGEFLVHTAGPGAPKDHGELKLRTALKNVLYAELTEQGEVLVSTLALKKTAHMLVLISGRPREGETAHAESWIGRLTQAAGCNMVGRRLRVIINPYGGKGTARSIFEKRVRPVFEAAKCIMDVTYTASVLHAETLAREMALTYDAVVVVSGDGVIHEVFNGFAQRSDAGRAFQTPVVQIPAGSGNAFSYSMMGLKEGGDIALSALNAVKGSHMKLDLASITQGTTRRVSFLSQALGLMADLDVGTDHMRWMGEKRFVVGFLAGLIAPKPCPIRVFLKVAESDKEKMAEEFRQRNLQDVSHEVLNGDESDGMGLPPLRYQDSQGEGWYEFPEKIFYFYAGLMPYVSRDVMAFPVAKPTDGLIDVVIQAMSKNIRSIVLGSMDGSEKGMQFWAPTQHYFKVEAYRVTPLVEKGHLAVDGEAWPFKSYQVEVLQRLGTTLSMSGRFMADF